jgi:dTDP-4-dehydrorhamnose reductase
MPYVESNLKPLTFVLDVANKAASIPGNGNEVMTLTYTKDLAKFVVVALDLPKWTYPMVCYSEKTTWNKALEIAEECRGMCVLA